MIEKQLPFSPRQALQRTLVIKGDIPTNPHPACAAHAAPAICSRSPILSANRMKVRRKKLLKI
jgi:hypothetical protein